MAQPGDWRLENGVWQGLEDDGTTWETMSPSVQQYMSRNFSGVSGTGNNQLFSSFSTDPPMSKSQVDAAVVNVLQGGTGTPNPATAGTQGERIRDAYRTWTNKPDAEWPPMKEDVTSPRWEMVGGQRQFTGYNTIQDTEAIDQFLTYAKQNNIRFTDAELQASGVPKAVTIGGQQYFQQPGFEGQFERIPQAEGAGAAPSIEEHGGIQFINQGGELVPIDNVMKKMKENFVVTGDFEGAAAVHQWETRPSNQEYFDRMLQYVNAPADQLLISAIARGQGLVAPPPEETIQRIGPPPEYLTEAFNMLRDQMQMGQPGEGQTAQEVMLERAAKREEEAAQLQLQSQEIANRTAEFQLQSQQVQAEDTHNAAVANLNAANQNNQINAVNSQLDIEDRIASVMGGDVRSRGIGDVDEITGDSLSPAAFMGSLPVAQRPQMKEYNDVAAEFANTGFQFGEVRGISREDMAAFINSLSPEQRKLAEQQFKDQGGLANAGAFFDSVAGLEKALNFHLDARDMALVDLNKDGQSETGQEDTDDDVSETGGEVISPTGDKIITDKSTAVTKTIDVGEEGVDEAVGDLDPSPTMTQAEIFEKYPFLAPEGWGQGVVGTDVPTETRPPQLDPAVSPAVSGSYGQDVLPPTAPVSGVGQYGGLPTGIPLYGMDIPTGPGNVPGPFPLGAESAPGYRVGTDTAVPRPGAQPSTIQPWERARATDAFELDPWAAGLDFIPDEYVPPPEPKTRADRQAEKIKTAQESQRDAAMRERLEEIAEEPQYYDLPGYGATDRRIDADEAEIMYSPYEYEESAPITPHLASPAPTPAPVVTPAGWGTEEKDPETMAGRWYDEGAHGIRTGTKPTLVGESGPELALFPNGTEIVPLDRPMRPSQARRLRRRGIRGMQEGGLVFGPDQYMARGGDAGVRGLPGYKGSDKFVTSDTLSRLRSGSLRQDPQNLSRIYDPNAPVPTPKLPRETASSVYDSPLPLGIRQLQAGRSLGAPRGQLLRTAGIALPSAQARRRMLPSEREAFEGLGRMAGIPAGEFQQELGITTPSGAPRTGNARMLPLSLRR